MALVKDTTFTGKISSEDKKTIADIAFKVNVSMSSIMVSGTLKEAKRLEREFNKNKENYE